VHVAAALDPVGGLLGVAEFPVTPAGYARLLSWLSGFGTVCLVGIEGTGSYGAGLARHVATAGIRVVEVDRSDRQDRRRQGKSDPLDAVSAARAAQSGRAAGAPKGRDGSVEAIRALMVAKRSARAERTQTINQARSLIVTGPHGGRRQPLAPATQDATQFMAFHHSLSMLPMAPAQPGPNCATQDRPVNAAPRYVRSGRDAPYRPGLTGRAPRRPGNGIQPHAAADRPDLRQPRHAYGGSPSRPEAAQGSRRPPAGSPGRTVAGLLRSAARLRPHSQR
jgi:hypothetical protein